MFPHPTIGGVAAWTFTTFCLATAIRFWWGVLNRPTDPTLMDWTPGVYGLSTLVLSLLAINCGAQHRDCLSDTEWRAIRWINWLGSEGVLAMLA